MFLFDVEVFLYIPLYIKLQTYNISLHDVLITHASHNYSMPGAGLSMKDRDRQFPSIGSSTVTTLPISPRSHCRI